MMDLAERHLKRALIAGCGKVGIALASLLVADGCEVWGLRRRVDRLPSAIQPISADLSQQISPSLIPPRLDTVFYLPAADRRDETSYIATYVNGLSSLLIALSKSEHGHLRLIYVSSTAVYAQDSGEEVDEESVAAPRAFNGKILLRGEAL